MRGDGPYGAPEFKAAGVAPPHARGWTRVVHHQQDSAPGSPACAGMDPTGPCRRSGSARLPRMRGDGPGLAALGPQDREAPPHARGWTDEVAGPVQGVAGSPACAGMDLCSRRTRQRSPWLPRMRGDGPIFTHPGRGGSTAPPHARGWTASSPASDLPAVGSPACAGMDRCRARSRRCCQRLPRMRGDGPYYTAHALIAKEAPPHARGWTPRS